MSQQGREKGKKEVIIMRCYKIQPMSIAGYERMKKKFKRPYPYVFMPMHVIDVNVNNIDTYRKLAYMVRQYYGFGRFMVSFWDKRKKNKKFKKTFMCTMPDCKFYQNKKCRFYSRHKQGDACRANPKHKPYFSRRAEVEIMPTQIDDQDGYDFTFKYNKRKTNMSWFWFWKGSRDKNIIRQRMRK